MVSEEQNKKEEKENVKKVLKCNGYKNWAMKISEKESKDLNVTQKGRKHTSSIGIQGLSEQLQWIFKKQTKRDPSETEGQNTHGTAIGVVYLNICITEM